MNIDPSRHFSPDYEGARQAFRAAARARGATLTSHPIAARPVAGDELSIDVAYLGPESPARLIVLSSGLHGVEGFAGSAIQHYLLQEQFPGLELPEDCGLLVVHALNPYGFSELRRVNESNVDLNRNFLEHPEEHVPNPGYEELYDAINPTSLDEEVDLPNRTRILEFGQKYGMPKLQAVLTVGQYVHPEGVQFGGDQPEESNRLLREIAVRETRGAARVAWIDFHTGLGPWGEVEMISELHPMDADFRRARAWFGRPSAAPWPASRFRPTCTARSSQAWPSRSPIASSPRSPRSSAPTIRSASSPRCVRTTGSISTATSTPNRAPRSSASCWKCSDPRIPPGARASWRSGPA